MDVACKVGVAREVFFGDGDAEFLAYCAADGGVPAVVDVPAQPEPSTVDDLTVDFPVVDKVSVAPTVVDSWEAFLVRYGCGWSGDDDLWTPFRHWFAHHAVAHGYGDRAAAFLDSMDHQPDRVTAFAWHGVPVTRPVVVPRQAVDLTRCPYDLAAWVAFLGERAATWDGSDDSWPAFREAFLLAADGLLLTIPASAFVDYVDSQPDRLTVFGRYGLLPAAEATEAADPVQPAEPTTVAADRTDKTDKAETTEVAETMAARPVAKRRAVRAVSATAKRPRVRSSTRRTAA